jgi:type I restriction enzyme S subunit
MFKNNERSEWRSGVISDLGNVVGGGTPSKSNPDYYCEEGIGWITPKDLSNRREKFIAHGATDITQLGYEKSSASLLPAGTVLFSSRAPIGYMAIASEPIATNQGFKSVIPFENTGTAFVYYCLKNNMELIESRASGSTFKEISGSGMKSTPIVIPDDELIQKFNEFCTPIFQLQHTLEKESVMLERLKNSLLRDLFK